MATLTQHAPGTFCWPELGTSDQDAAKKFYTAVFGWTFNDMPMPEGVYTIFRHKDRDVAACYTLNAQMQPGVPPYWGAYVSVEDASATAKRVTELSGTVIAEPMDVMNFGRMAVLRDPTGAMFCVWQPIQHIGAGLLDEPGALCWTELMTSDTAKAGAFYRALIGWKSNDMPMPGAGTYTIFQRPDGANAAGMMALTPEMKDVPPNWMNYFQTADIRANVAKITSLGGRIIVPPSPVPNIGEFAVCQDPQGAVFSLLQASQ
jgi:hypothetical protein